MTTTSSTEPATALPAKPESLLLTPLIEHGSASVSLSEVVRLAFDSLLSNKVRALLTMLGVIIGVASVVTLMAIGTGASNYITGQFSALGSETLTIMPGSASNNGPGSSAQAQTLTLADSDAITALKLPLVGPAPQYGGQAQIVASAADTNSTVTGITPAYQQIESLTLASGQFIDSGHVSGASQVVVLGSSLAEELFGAGQAVGQTVRIKGQIFRVIGVLTTKGSGGFGSVDDRALVPLSVAQQRLFGGRTPDGNNWQVSQISVSVNDKAQMTYVTERISMLLRDRHDLQADGSEDDFNVMDQSSIVSTLTTITTLLTYFLAAIAGISLLVGGIGIMNIMLVSVTERTREIGLRKAVGARPNDILMQFIAEALMLSLTGGVIGLLTGCIIPVVVSLLGLLDATITVGSVALAVGFSLAVGLFFGIYPARRASQLNPIQALRYE